MKLSWRVASLIPFTALIFFGVSCRDNTSSSPFPIDSGQFKPAVVRPLEFTKPVKMAWVKKGTVRPLVRKIDLSQIRSVPYDSAGFKPFYGTVYQSRFNYDSLPAKDIDIDKLPAVPLTFRTFKADAPKIIRSGLPALKYSGTRDIYNLGEMLGLKGTLIHDIYKSHDGFLWIFANNKLYRYDGESLTLFITRPIRANYYIGKSLMEDDTGRLWVNDTGEVLVLDPKSGTIKQLLHSNKQNYAGFNDLVMDGSQRIWTKTLHGNLYIIDLKNDLVRELDAGMFSSRNVFGYMMDKHNNLWIGTDHGLNIIDLKNSKIRYLQKDTVSPLICDHQGRMWVETATSISLIDIKKGVIQEFHFSAIKANLHNLWDYLVTPDNKLWLNSTTDVKIIDMDHQLFKTFMTAAHPENKIFNLETDGNGAVWLCSDDGISLYSHNPMDIAQVPGEEATATTEDDKGLLWVGSLNGIAIVDTKNKTIKQLTRKQGLLNDSVQFIREMNGKMYIGTNSGLNIIDQRHGTITGIRHSAGMDNQVITSAMIDGEGRIWMGGLDEAGVEVFDPRDGSLAHLDKAGGLSDNYVVDIVADDQKNTWIITQGGVDVIEAGTDQIKSVKNIPSSGNNWGQVILPRKNGNIWVGLSNGGVAVINLKKKTLTGFGTPQGLTDSRVLSLSALGNTVYAGTRSGLTMISDSITFKKNYLLGKSDFATYADLVTKNGLYCWADRGVTLLDLSKKQDRHWPVFVTGITILDQPKYYSSASKDDDSIAGPFNMPIALRLPHHQNCLRFSFAAANLDKHDTTWYSYLLEGQDTKWSPPTFATSTGNYFNLAPGKYVFKIASKERGGSWGKVTLFAFTILPPWWLTWWALAGYIILGALVVYAAIYYRSLQLIKEKRLLEKEVGIRTEEVLQQKEELAIQHDKLETEKIRSGIAADFHDELGSTLSSIALYSEMAVKGNFEDEQRTKSILTLISESSRSTVSAMQDMIWTLQPKNDSMLEVIYRMREYAYPMAELKNINLVFEIGENVQELVLPMDTRKNTYLVFKEALNNAFKYASANRIDIHLAQKENVLFMEIKDNGKGFDAAEIKPGNGLTNMYKRAELASGSLCINSIKSIGTIVVFSCPVL